MVVVLETSENVQFRDSTGTINTKGRSSWVFFKKNQVDGFLNIDVM